MEGRRVRSEASWGAAREAYLAGLSAGEVCARFDLGLSALKQRARREGWRRADQPDPDPDLSDAPEVDDGAQLAAELEALGDADFELMASRAARMAQRAVVKGELKTAEAWMRLHARLEPHASHARHVRSLEERDAAWAAQAEAAAEAADAGDVHSVHSVHHDLEAAPKAEATEPPASPLGAPARRFNRADRRRQARLADYKSRLTAHAGSAQGP